MNGKILKWTIRLTLTILIILGLVVFIVLNPSVAYANKTILGKSTVYHNKPLDKELESHLENAIEILKSSELYDSRIKFDICMNDGSFYPSLLELFLGEAFALGFTSNKIVICGDINYKGNYVEVNGYKWNLDELLAHEGTHCLVFRRIGFWKSNPMASNPKWKWEGYPEYISRRNSNQTDLVKNIDLLKSALQLDSLSWGISFLDGTTSPVEYFKYRLLNQYCFEIKKMTFDNFLLDTTDEQNIKEEMMKWYLEQKLK